MSSFWTRNRNNRLAPVIWFEVHVGQANKFDLNDVFITLARKFNKFSHNTLPLPYE
jgi:hypothetical protein